ncbi:MAG: hypothetical protein H8D71_01090 [Deltaproteobacteria bacterium]|nr:hypothetical protein [Deltaproteobacteria bacterium]
MWFILAALTSSGIAEAACNSLVQRASASSGKALGKNFAALARCSADEAEIQFDNLLPRAKTVDDLVTLSMSAIESDVWTPVWRVLSHDALDYETRDQVAKKIGANCTTNPKIVSFFKGAYFALRDLEFQQWDDGMVACMAPDWAEWLNQQATTPPQSIFDEKYNALLNVVTIRSGADAIPILQEAAIKGAAAGPFNAILIQMEAAVQPGIGEPKSPENQARLEAALVNIASNVNQDKARSVADRLANAGANASAAKLLTSIYPNRADSDGAFTYGATSVEKATCDGAKKLVLHIAKIEEPGTRWIILNDIRAPMRALKPRLGKCAAEGSEWGVSTTPEPLASPKDLDRWVDSLEKQWADKGYDVSVRKEKTIRLP